MLQSWEKQPVSLPYDSLNLDVSNTGNCGSFFPDSSADGSVLVFSSDGTDLVVDDTKDARDIFSIANPFLP